MLNSIAQDAFDAGIVREVEGQRIPANGAYDIVDGLLDDDLAVYRRGGSSYKSTSDIPAASSSLQGIADASASAGGRTLFWTATQLATLAADDVTPIVLGVIQTVPLSRAVTTGGMIALRHNTAPQVTLYGGSRKTSSYGVGTITVTAGSQTVTGVGTAWSANVDAGMVLTVGSDDAIVASVTNNTTLLLRDPWAGATSAGAAYGLSATVSRDISTVTGPLTAIATAGTRLILCTSNRAYMTVRGNPRLIADVTTDYHELPSDAQIIGAQGVGDQLILFTTSGTWQVANLAYDLTDAYGNVQHTVEKVNDLILWGDSGVAAWRGSLVMPAVDDVYLMGIGSGATAISGVIRPLYRTYVAAGYQTGTATVYRGHYFLPVVDASNGLVDVLVCRLDGTTAAWTRWAGHAAGVAYTQRVGTSTRRPLLLAASSSRVLDLSGTFVPAASNKNEADGTTQQLTLITRDFTTRRTGANLWKYLRARIELEDASTDNPYLSLEYQVGSHSSSWTVVSGNAPESDGTDDFEWNPDLRAQAIRFRIKSNGPTAKCVLRSLEVFFRPSGKR